VGKGLPDHRMSNLRPGQGGSQLLKAKLGIIRRKGPEA
jgi:hypothetical protein